MLLEQGVELLRVRKRGDLGSEVLRSGTDGGLIDLALQPSLDRCPLRGDRFDVATTYLLQEEGAVRHVGSIDPGRLVRSPDVDDEADENADAVEGEALPARRPWEAAALA